MGFLLSFFKNVQKNVQNLRGLVEPMKKNIGKAL